MPALTDWWTKYKSDNPIMDLNFNKTTAVGALPAVLSQENVGPASGFVKRFSEQNGKIRTAKFKYKQRRLASEILSTAVDGAPNYCSASQTPTYLEDEKTVNNEIYKQFFIPDNDVRNYEENFDQVFRDEMQANLNAHLEKLNTLTIAAFEAQRANTSAGDTVVLTGEGFSDLSTYTVNHEFKEKVRAEFRKLQNVGQKILVGDGLVPAYYNMLDDGADNNTRGQQIGRNIMRDFMFYDDTMLDTEVAGTNNALIWQPGSFQMLEWFKNVSDFRRIQDRRVDDTITLNLGGRAIRFDIYMRENHCQDNQMGLLVTLRKWYDFWSFPADIFAASDPLNGTNGMERWQMTAP